MDPTTIAGAVAALIGLFKGGGNSSQPTTGLPPELLQMLTDAMGYQSRRLQRVEPLHQAALAMATRMAPGYARNAMQPTPPSSAPSRPSNPFAPPQSYGTGDSLSQLVAQMGIPSGGGYPTGSPGAPDPYLLGSPSLGPKGPGMDPNAYRYLSPEMLKMFFGNPYGAFFGGYPWGGQQEYGGGREEAR
jgi:hypothetical protein